MLSRILYINLTTKSVKIRSRVELFRKYLGGTGVAIRLLLEECPQNVDPFSPDAPIIMAAGPLTGLLPCCTKTVCMFKSPLTGNLGETHAGGRLASAIRFAGFGAIVIKGFADKLTYVTISDQKVGFHDAGAFKGQPPSVVEKALRIPNVEGLQSVVSIGLAGEKLVWYATANVDTYNHFGRLGLGAIFASKNLKAISITGTGEISAVNADALKLLYEELYQEAEKKGKMRKYHDLGTMENVLVLNEINALPTKNFTSGRFDFAENISGEAFAEKQMIRKVSCPGCPIGCMHIAALKIPFATQHEIGPIFLRYDYEPVYALGSNLLIKDQNDLLKLILLADEYGLDAMMLGTVLAWVTEAYEKGLISTSETLNVKPCWGDVESYIQITKNIVKMPNLFYTKLAQGVAEACEKYGGKDFAMAIGKNGLAGYLTGYAAFLGTLVGARHSHNSNAGYSIDQEACKSSLTHSEMVDKLIEEENWRCIQTSLVICLFARGIYTEEKVVEALKLVGINRSIDELKKLGREIFQNQYKFKFREGFDFHKENLPNRIFETPTLMGKLDRNVFTAMLAKYISKRFKRRELRK
ncbi:aldehyde ferredoxin oxidoreductase family protein [Candidatus Bathyarchaeota archaeon]|nr:aldehyde ferredoxin oxidoreductase family protein [Candidatus Bathyarchaeota archaeon]